MLNCICPPDCICCHIGMLKYWKVGMLEDMLEFSFYHCFFLYYLLTLNSNMLLPHITIVDI